MDMEKWRNRPMTTRVFELCPACQVLKEDVKKRESKSYWGYGVNLTMTACAPCFDDEKRRLEQEAKELA